MLELRRNYRMPNMGELYKPAHAGEGTTTLIVGNKYVSPEATVEAAGRIYGLYGPFENEVRATFISARNPILHTASTIDGVDYVRPENAGSQNITVIEDRFRLSSRAHKWATHATGGVEFTLGDRVGFFQAMPEYRVNAGLAIGRNFFNDSSELTLGADYQHVSSRFSNGFNLDAFNVLNARIEFRLVDARAYLMWLNVFDEEYATVAPYLMQPRQFLFGIEWTLFE